MVILIDGKINGWEMKKIASNNWGRAGIKMKVVDPEKPVPKIKRKKKDEEDLQLNEEGGYK